MVVVLAPAARVWAALDARGWSDALDAEWDRLSEALSEGALGGLSAGERWDDRMAVEWGGLLESVSKRQLLHAQSDASCAAVSGSASVVEPWIWWGAVSVAQWVSELALPSLAFLLGAVGWAGQ